MVKDEYKESKCHTLGNLLSNDNLAKGEDDWGMDEISWIMNGTRLSVKKWKFHQACRMSQSPRGDESIEIAQYSCGIGVSVHTIIILGQSDESLERQSILTKHIGIAREHVTTKNWNGMIARRKDRVKVDGYLDVKEWWACIWVRDERIWVW